MDRIEQVRIFIRVAESGGFTLAADQLGLPRATVSLAIQQLERRLGCRLLHRTTRSVSLTADGQALIPNAKALLAGADALEQQFRTGSDAVTGHLRVELPTRLARLWVVTALPGFMRSHPGIALSLSASDQTADLVRDGIDAALRVGELPASSLVAKPMGVLRMVNCASPGYLARMGTPRAVAELDRHVAVNYAVNSGDRSATWTWQDAHTTHTRHVPSSVAVSDVEAYIACGLAGLGLIQIPAFDAQAALARGELIEVLPDWPAPPMPMHLVFPHRRLRHRRVQVFCDWLTQVLAPCWQ